MGNTPFQLLFGYVTKYAERKSKLRYQTKQNCLKFNTLVFKQEDFYVKTADAQGHFFPKMNSKRYKEKYTQLGFSWQWGFSPNEA